MKSIAVKPSVHLQWVQLKVSVSEYPLRRQASTQLGLPDPFSPFSSDAHWLVANVSVFYHHPFHKSSLRHCSYYSKVSNGTEVETEDNTETSVFMHEKQHCSAWGGNVVLKVFRIMSVKVDPRFISYVLQCIFFLLSILYVSVLYYQIGSRHQKTDFLCEKRLLINYFLCSSHHTHTHMVTLMI